LKRCGSRRLVKTTQIHPTPTYRGEYNDPGHMRLKQGSEAKGPEELEATIVAPWRDLRIVATPRAGHGGSASLVRLFSSWLFVF